MKVLFMVRREYYDQIVAGSKTFEVRKATERWRSVAIHLETAGGIHEAVFICGRRPVHRRQLVGTYLSDNAREALGREPSEQERKDLGDGEVITFSLGRML